MPALGFLDMIICPVLRWFLQHLSWYAAVSCITLNYLLAPLFFKFNLPIMIHPYSELTSCVELVAYSRSVWTACWYILRLSLWSALYHRLFCASLRGGFKIFLRTLPNSDLTFCHRKIAEPLWSALSQAFSVVSY